MQIRSYTTAKILMDHFDGECFDSEGQLLIIVGVDEGGCVCEDVDGDEQFYDFHQLNIDENTYNEILEIKNEQRSSDWFNLDANGEDYKNKIDLILARSESLSDEEFNELYNLGIEAINKVSKSK